jgi:hypothetical protein
MKNTLRIIIVLAFTLAINLSTYAQILTGRSNALEIDLTEKPVPAYVSSGSSNSELGVSTLPRYHALIIGVSEYEFSGARLPNLDKPVQDAEQLKDILIEYYTFAENDIYLLNNPTRENIINAFDKMIETVGARDNLLIFYAGHGYYDKATDFGFWLPANAKTTSRSDWIPNSTIKDYVSAVPAKHTLLITDACFGGSIFKTRTTTVMDSRKVFDLYRDRSRKAITSGNLTEVPDQSFFIKILLKVLEDNNQDYLPASSLFSRIYEPILNNSPTVPQFGVIQGAGDEGGDFIFIKKQ